MENRPGADEDHRQKAKEERAGHGTRHGAALSRRNLKDHRGKDRKCHEARGPGVTRHRSVSKPCSDGIAANSGHDTRRGGGKGRGSIVAHSPFVQPAKPSHTAGTAEKEQGNGRKQP